MSEEFESEWLPHLQDLTLDKIVNVRIQLAQTLEAFFKKFEISSILKEKKYRDRMCEHHALQSMVHRLKYDSCRDIRFSVRDIYTKFDDGELVEFTVSSSLQPTRPLLMNLPTQPNN